MLQITYRNKYYFPSENWDRLKKDIKERLLIDGDIYFDLEKKRAAKEGKPILYI